MSSSPPDRSTLSPDPPVRVARPQTLRFLGARAISDLQGLLTPAGAQPPRLWPARRRSSASAGICGLNHRRQLVPTIDGIETAHHALAGVHPNLLERHGI